MRWEVAHEYGSVEWDNRVSGGEDDRFVSQTIGSSAEHAFKVHVVHIVQVVQVIDAHQPVAV